VRYKYGAGMDGVADRVKICAGGISADPVEIDLIIDG
jgi:hypothetical protein